jgi:hypothetical protein
VHAVVSDVPGEDSAVVELPQRVRVRFAGPDLAHREAQATEAHVVAVVHRAVGEHPPGRPLVAHHGADDLVLELIVPADHRVDGGGRDDRDVVSTDKVRQTRVVIGMGMGDHHARQRVPAVVDRFAHQCGVGDGQHAVDHDDSVRPVYQERVDGHHPSLDSVDLTGHGCNLLRSMRKPWT